MVILKNIVLLMLENVKCLNLALIMLERKIARNGMKKVDIAILKNIKIKKHLALKHVKFVSDQKSEETLL